MDNSCLTKKHVTSNFTAEQRKSTGSQRLLWGAAHELPQSMLSSQVFNVQPKKESLSYVVTLWFYTNYIYLYTIFNQFHGPTPFFDPILNQGPLVDIHYFIVGVEKIQTRNTRLDGVAPSVVRKKWGKYFLKANLAILSLHLYVSGRPVHKLGCSYSFIGGMIPMELAMQPWLVTCTEVS